MGNPVTAVLIAYRALDTLLEKVVLLLALVGVWSLAPDRFWGGAAGSTAIRRRPDGALALLARLLPPVGIVVGIYMLWVGAIAPGGAFQGGAILAAMWLLVMIAGLRTRRRSAGGRLRLALVVGPAVFLAVGVGGLRALPGGFLSYPPAIAKPLIIVDRGGADAVDRGDPRPAGGRAADTANAAMTAATLFGLCGAALVGLGLYGADRASAAVAQDPGVQPAGRRRVPAVRRDRPARRGGRPGRPIRCRRRWSSPASSSPSRPPRWRSRCCCGCSRYPGGRRARMPASPSASDAGSLTAPGGFLLVLAIVLPVAGVLLSLALGGRAGRARCAGGAAGRASPSPSRSPPCLAFAAAAAGLPISAAGRRRSASRCAPTACRRRCC